MFVSSTGRRTIIRMSTIGSGTRSSTKTQATSMTTAATSKPTIRPDVQPQLAFGEREQERHQPAREEQRTRQVDARGRLDRRFGHEPCDERERERDADRAEDEQPPPGEVVDDQAAEHDPEAAADAEDRAHQADPDADLLGRELVADDRERERKHRCAAARERAERDQRADVPREGAADAAEEKDPEADHEQSPLAVLVAELAEDRRRDGRDEQEDGEHPRRPRGVVSSSSWMTGAPA